MRRKKGFSLIELIIVLAIIAILAGVLIPSWGYYIQRSRTRSQNNRAKIIFNAAQTVVTEMQMNERKILNEYDLASTTDKAKYAEKMYTHYPKMLDEWYFYFDGSNGRRVNADGTALNKDKDTNLGYTQDAVNAMLASDWNSTLVRNINKILDKKKKKKKIYVKDYQVKAVVSARSENDRYLGAFPGTLDDLDKAGADLSAVRAAHVRGADMKQFDDDSTT